MVAVKVGVAIVLQVACAEAWVAEQVHIAFGRTPDVMAVQWAVRDNATCSTPSVVLYSKTKETSDDDGESEEEWALVAEGSCFPFSLGGGNLAQSHHVANLTSLMASHAYTYEIANGSFSASFATPPDATTLAASLPQRFLVYGDMGSDSAGSGPSDSSTILPAIKSEVDSGKYASGGIIHVGDFAYNLDSDYGERGATFMNDVQNVSARVPYAVCVGNHESAFNFAYYTEFFARVVPTSTPWFQQSDAGPAPNAHYYSYNVGLVHFVVVSTEIPFDYPGESVDDMRAWLISDLQVANTNRTFAPWIITYGHRSLYCSCDGDCDDDATTLRRVFADVFHDYGVDLFLNGHEHNYERMFDVAPDSADSTWLSGTTTRSTVDMPATTFIVTGDAGSDEDHEVFARDMPNRTAFRTDAYGYSRLEIFNATHLHWQQIEYDQSDPTVGTKPGAVVDDVWLVQHFHGPFSSASRQNYQGPTSASSSSDGNILLDDETFKNSLVDRRDGATVARTGQA